MKYFIFFFVLFCFQTLQAKIKVVAANSFIADFIENVCSEACETVVLVGKNQEIHDYRPTPRDLKKVIQSDLFFAFGQGIEEWMGSVKNLKGGFKLVEVSSGLNLLKDSHGETDIHFWQSPENVKAVLKNIVIALSENAMDKKDFFKKNSLDFENKLDHFLKKIHVASSENSFKNCQILSPSNAFKYIEPVYNIKIWTIDSSHHDEGLTAKKVADLIRISKKEKLKAIVGEKGGKRSAVAQIAKEAKMKHVGDLCSDSLTVEDYCGSYLQMLNYNFEVLKKACEI